MALTVHALRVPQPDTLATVHLYSSDRRSELSEIVASAAGGILHVDDLHRLPSAMLDTVLDLIRSRRYWGEPLPARITVSLCPQGDLGQKAKWILCRSALEIALDSHRHPRIA